MAKAYEVPAQVSEDDDEYMTSRQVSDRLNRPMGTLRQWKHRGFGPKGFSMGGVTMYRRSAVEAFLRECENAGQQDEVA